ncbi:hypothetical protein O6H91_14G000700 [Diphasiastrum complanatum]|uniref:Uncharacterized protein n=1 Tax=Diphasiastrum complanatum TaxID=34168 RepID=A0ACC2BKT1_DIPCM|nr:hypothetical protein O6H91_14G000700 [Diphasiastrum complanatum]
MDEENKEQKSMPSLSWCSDFVPSLGRTRCYKCNEMGHSAQNCQSCSNSYMLDLSKSGGRAPANVTHSNQTPFSCVCATINYVVVSRGGTKVLEPTHIGLGGKSLENIQLSFRVELSHCSTPIVIPETLSTRVHHSEGPMKVSCMASCVPMVSRGLLPEGKSPCSEVSNDGKVSIERSTIDLKIKTMGIRAVPFPGRATFGVTITRAPAIPELNYLWRGGYQVFANGKLSCSMMGLK